jgi:sodium-dependent phosphate transporter
MRNLGNRLTLHSPSRGFSMELGSVITIILATRLSTFNPSPSPKY